MSKRKHKPAYQRRGFAISKFDTFTMPKIVSDFKIPDYPEVRKALNHAFYLGAQWGLAASDYDRKREKETTKT